MLRIGGFVLAIAKISNSHADKIQPSAQPRYWGSSEITVRCIQAIAETHDVKTFRFVAEPPLLFSYQPGQFVTLDLEIEGKRVMRSYSISSTPSRPHILEITVKRVSSPIDEPDAPPGLVSNWLHDRLTVGSQIKLSGAMGKFTVDNTAQKLLFISAGSGITPMMSMSRWICDTGANTDLVFIHSARSPRDFIFRHELESMAARYDNFKLAVTTTGSEPGRAWQGYTGRLNELMLQAIAPDWQERTVYVCGANLFMQGVKTMLETLGFPMKNYHQESFGGSIGRSSKNKTEVAVTKVEAAKVISLSSRCSEPDYTQFTETENTLIIGTTHQSPVVVFTKSDKEIFCDLEDIILEVAEREGIELPFGCRMGACGACKLPLLAREVNYDDDPVCEPGHLLSCIAKASGRVVIEA
ncbi:FAD-binding oxidoreductase [Pleurocapsa sp. FMAR1]|uniref:FAD-binding oxidoreductase n=1 Tax=Pleurocapsa sp. FMAR1 TaxID=3040204 RepID=UPI0029C7AEED|nr:FAD-binding oxidoreductase [Pleurocapsa sp. FMAR1]